jgi:hypothetical protein
MDHRVIGERSDAVLQTAMPGGDEERARHCEWQLARGPSRFFPIHNVKQWVRLSSLATRIIITSS